jgi:tRNA-dihydrouridine synthase 4
MPFQPIRSCKLTDICYRKTVDFINTVLGHDQQRNIDFLTIHPRTRSTRSTIPINLEALEFLTSTFGDRVPILLSGDVFTLGSLPFPASRESSATFTTSSDEEPQQSTMPKHSAAGLPKLAGLMSARGILANPALFAGFDRCPWEAVEIFMNNAARCPLPFKVLVHHLSDMCGPGFGPNKTSLLTRQDRMTLMACSNMLDLVDFLDEKMVALRKGGRGLRRDN